MSGQAQNMQSRLENRIDSSISRMESTINCAVNRMENRIEQNLSTLSSEPKKLDTLEKRKNLIDTLLRVDDVTGKIIIGTKLNLIYEHHQESLRENISGVTIFQIESIDDNYTQIYLKTIWLGGQKNEYATGASIETLNSRLVGTRVAQFSYNEDLDIFTHTVGSAENTFSSLGQFNSVDSFKLDIWENEDGRYSRNALVGNRIFTNITSNELSAEDRALLKDNSFDELYEYIWENNHNKPISENDNMLEGFKNFIGYTATRSSGRILHRNVWNRRIVNPNAQNAVLQNAFNQYIIGNDLLGTSQKPLTVDGWLGNEFFTAYISLVNMFSGSVEKIPPPSQASLSDIMNQTISDQHWEQLTGRKVENLVVTDNPPESKHNLMNISLYYAFDNLVSASKDFMLVLVDFLTSEGISTFQQGGTDGKYRVTTFDPAAVPAPAPAQPTTSSGVQQMTADEKLKAIQNLDGLWELTDGHNLYEDPLSDILPRSKSSLYLWFKLVRDKSENNYGLYQLTFLRTHEVFQNIINIGATTHANMEFSDKFKSSCALATMVYDENLGVFNTTTVDVDDTTVMKFSYKGGSHVIMEDYESGNDGKHQSNAYVSCKSYRKLSESETFNIVGNETAENAYKLTWQKNHENLVKPAPAPAQPKLINTLYYKLINNIGPVYNHVYHKSTEGGESGYAVSFLLTNNKWERIPETLIAMNGHFIYPNNSDNSGIIGRVLHEKFVIKDSDGDKLTYSGSYEEESEALESVYTFSDKVEFIVLGGTGKYKNASYVVIEYDNDTIITEGEGARNLRVVKIYGN